MPEDRAARPTKDDEDDQGVTLVVGLPIEG